MTSTTIETEPRPARRVIPAIVRRHLFLSLATLCLLLGTGFRFAAGTASGAGASGPSATACAAK